MGSRQPGPGCGVEPVQSTILFSSLPTAATSPGQVQESGGSKDDPHSSLVARENLFPSTAEHAVGLSPNPSHQSDDSGSHVRSSPSRPQEAQTDRLLDFWEVRQESLDLSQSARQLVEASWRGSTEQRYAGAWGRWVSWCKLHKIQAAAPSLSNVINYLATLFESGAQYRTINLHRSALSSTLKPIDGFPVGQHPLICRLLKGAYNSRPPRPKLCPTWSVHDVLSMLKKWAPASSLDLKRLTLKTSMLLALTSAKRPSSLSLFSVKAGYCELGESTIRLQPTALEKSEGPDHCAKPLTLHQFSDEPRLCPVSYVKAYIDKTALLRSSDKFFISYIPPHGAVAAQTISRWLQETISQCGQSGPGGSTRSASTSKAVLNGSSLAAVLEAGDWARASTFSRFYYKPASMNFQSAVLSSL